MTSNTNSGYFGTTTSAPTIFFTWVPSLPQRPMLSGYGPVEFSTCLELQPRLAVVWDANGYYRELGVSSDATRKEIREAYQKKKGWRNARLTYIMKQLLDRAIRSKYDATPIGSLFVDAYVMDRLRAEEARRAAEERARWAGSTSMWDHIAEPEPEVYEEREDFDSIDDNLSDPGSIVTEVLPDESWDWAYYLWQSVCDDRTRLRQWQELLISILGERKEHHQIAIGFLGGDEAPFKVETVGYRTVVFLNDREQPTEALAQRASRAISQHLKREIKKSHE